METHAERVVKSVEHLQELLGVTPLGARRKHSPGSLERQGS